MYVIEPGRWYGWPDFYAGHLLDEENRGKSHPGPPMRPLLARHPSQPPEPVAAFGVHASADGSDFSRNPAFGNVGQAFVAQLGAMVPGVGKTLAPAGFTVVKVDVAPGPRGATCPRGGRAQPPPRGLRGVRSPPAVRASRPGLSPPPACMPPPSALSARAIPPSAMSAMPTSRSSGTWCPASARHWRRSA